MQCIIKLCARKRDTLENPISGDSKMSFQKLEPAPRRLSEVQLALSEIQTETILLALPGLCLGAGHWLAECGAPTYSVGRSCPIKPASPPCRAGKFIDWCAGWHRNNHGL